MLRRVHSVRRAVPVARSISVRAWPRLQRLSTTAAIATGGGGPRRGGWRLVGGSAAAATAALAVSASGVLDTPPKVEIEPMLSTEMVELRCRSTALVPSQPLSHSPLPPCALRSLYDEQGRLQLRVLGQLIVRCLELCVLFGPVALTALLLQTPLHARCRQPWLRYLVRTLARCGAVGIKWGQWASTRYDIFEDDVCQTLGELTNQAPVHSLAHTEKLIAAAFGASSSELFSSFDAAPLASGSIAQARARHAPA